MEIVKTYTDSGKSGLKIHGRPALQSLIADVQLGQTDYAAILVLDVTRWGRFQDADESAYYEYLCRRVGITQASRPFSRDRDGFVLGEGAAIMVIESLEHALNRGVEPIAELIGYGTSSDAYHVTCCHENGDALQRSMEMAIRMAGIDREDIGYLNAHGTSAPLGDKSELIAIEQVFGKNSNISISSTKSATGHLLGAAGSLEAIFTVLALKEETLPPTLNLEDPDPIAGDLKLIRAKSQKKMVRYGISNSAGFGGVNASLVFKLWEA